MSTVTVDEFQAESPIARIQLMRESALSGTYRLTHFVQDLFDGKIVEDQLDGWLSCVALAEGVSGSKARIMVQETVFHDGRSKDNISDAVLEHLGLSVMVS